MNTPVLSPARLADSSADVARMHGIFATQRRAFASVPPSSYEERLHRLEALRAALVRHMEALTDAVVLDYGHRSRDEMKFGEILFILEAIKYHRRHLKQWMRPQKRHVSLLQQPAKARVMYQPLGVVGIIVPWNYPVFLSLGPLLCAISAGNHAMIKTSSSTPHTGEALKRMLAEAFEENQVAVITGQGVISRAFSELPFDQITFTGSTNVGREVMEAAARQLTPVLLELGGKSPVIVHESYPMADLAERLAFGKCWNAGQTCIAPDYLLLPRGKSAEFAVAFSKQIAVNYPSLAANPDYTGIINERQCHRLQGLLEDAAAKGGELVSINPAKESFAGLRKLPVTLVLGVRPDMRIMQEEVFGPVLPVMEVDSVDLAVNYVNAQPRPLALYYFDYDRQRGEALARRTYSGGMCINDTMSHGATDDLPFGGVGASGMGKYHGHEGFLAMSNARAVLEKPRYYSLRGFLPPFNKPLHRFARKFLLR